MFLQAKNSLVIGGIRTRVLADSMAIAASALTTVPPKVIHILYFFLQHWFELKTLSNGGASLFLVNALDYETKNLYSLQVIAKV